MNNLTRLFSRTNSSDNSHKDHSNNPSRSPSPKKKPTTSPEKSKPSSPALSLPSSPQKPNPHRKHSKDHRTGSEKSWKPSPKRTHSKKDDKPYEWDSHPLNLPPDQLKRLSAMAAVSDNSMPSEVDGKISSSPLQGAPGAFPTSNGADNDEQTPPRPPPHRSPTSPGPKSPELSAAPSAESCKNAGNRFFKNKQYDKAIAEYTKAIAQDEDAWTYRNNRAAALMSATRYADALEDAKKADQLEPDNPKVLHRLARILTSMGRAREALDVYDRIQPPVSATDKASAKNMLQYISQAETQLKESTSGSMIIHALDQAERSLGVGFDRPKRWRLMRGEAYLKMGNQHALGDAQNVAMALLRENPQDPDALVLRGKVLYTQGENKKAIQHFRQALASDPDFKDGLRYLRMVQKLDRMKEEGNALVKSSQFKQAVEVYSQALEQDPNNKGTNSKLLQNRAICYSRLKQYKSAIEDCDRALQLDPGYTKARKTRAKALGEKGDWQQAVNDLKNVAENNPGEPGIAEEIRRAELELKKAQRKDYYKILGIDKDADDKQIKTAYRKLAIQTHPDKNPDDPEAEKRFKDVSEAYETLSDPTKKQRFDSGVDLQDPSDMFGGAGGAGMGGSPFGGGMGGGMGGMGGGVQIDPEMLFNMMNGGGMGGGRRGGGFNFSTGGGGMGGAGGARGGFSF